MIEAEMIEKLFVGGEWKGSSASGETFDVINPANGMVLATLPDIGRVLRLAENLEYGVIGANDGMPSTAQAPFGGLKESGFGREGGHYGIEEYLDVKYVSLGGIWKKG